MEPAEALAVMDAPGPMIAWIRDYDAEPEDLWSACPRGEWVAWLVPVVHVPLAVLIAATAELLSAHLESLEAGRAPLVYGLGTVDESLVREADREDLEDAATVCDQAAKDPPVTFRDSARTSYGAIAHAVASVVRAAEGLLSTRFRTEGERLRRAQDSARLFGTGADVFVSDEPALLLNPAAIEHDPAQADLLFVVASCADAMQHLEKVDGPEKSARALRTAIETRI